MEVSFPPGVRTAAIVAPVREVTLRGSADLRFWTERLQPEELVPEPDEGRATMLVVAARYSFKLVRAREASICVLVRPREGEEPGSSCFLERAFQSVRFFAWVERVFFHTPYFRARIAVDPAFPAAIDLRPAGGGGLAASMAPGKREPQASGEEGWAGRVHLPRRNPAQPRRVFHARLLGPTREFPFVPEDRLEIRPSPAHPVFRALLDSEFRGKAWVLRDGAIHAKSKTVLDDPREPR